MTSPVSVADEFDLIIVGAGAAGCVLAGRLSENAAKRILLIEAGPDAPPGREHPDIRDPFPVSLGNPLFFWPNLFAETGASPGEGVPRAVLPYLQGFGLGGGSSINGMVADRGQPQDYEGWSEYGAVGWGWRDVLPYFKKLERDLDFAGPEHGASGPIPIRRTKPCEWAPFASVLGRVLERRGYSMLSDYKTELRDGVGATPMNGLPDQRVSAAIGYLTTAVRSRSNFTLLTDALVERLEVRDGRVCGVQVRTLSGVRCILASETIVACGALHSPALLMRSGIGPAPALRAIGVDVVRNLPGVGQNLQNHPMVMLVTHLPRRARQSSAQRAWGQNQLRYSSKLAGCGAGDMLIVPINKASWHPLGKAIGAFLITVMRSYSTGSVDLTSKDPSVAPRVRFNLLDDARDFDRLVQAVGLTAQLLADPQTAPFHNEVFIPNGKVVASLGKRTPWNWLRAWIMALALEGRWLRRLLLRKSSLDIHAFAQDERAQRQYVRLAAQAAYHVAGTCRIGGAGDPFAVVDSDCRVLGVPGLRVIDASIFPRVPTGTTHVPVMMAAEKMADRIKVQWIER